MLDIRPGSPLNTPTQTPSAPRPSAHAPAQTPVPHSLPVPKPAEILSIEIPAASSQATATTVPFVDPPLPTPVEMSFPDAVEVGSPQTLAPEPASDIDVPLPTVVDLNAPEQVPAPPPTPGASLDEIRKNQGKLAPGQSSPDVPKLLEMLGKVGYKVKHHGNCLEGEVLRALQKFQADYGIAKPGSDYSGYLGPQTLKSLDNALSGPRINFKDPLMCRLNNVKLNSDPSGRHSCVETVLFNLDRLGVDTFPKDRGTTADPNNARGALVQIQNAGHWQSAPLPGSKLQTIHSEAYGTVKAHVLSASAYKALVNKGQIPNGCIIFQTEHGWNYSKGASGNDMGIVQNGKIKNYADMGGMNVYPDSLKEVVVMVPKGAIQR